MIPAYRSTFNELSRAIMSQRTHHYYYPWGVLAINPDNPDHYDANTATLETVANPEAALAECERVYREHDITPRICISSFSSPATLADFLQGHGYCPTTSADEPARIMHWEHTRSPAPSAPPGVCIRVASGNDIDAIIRIQYEEENLIGEWATRYLDWGLSDPRMTYFVADVDRVPAAVVAMGQLLSNGIVEDVATHPLYRGRGLAQLLIRMAQHHAATDLFLEVLADNAERIYARAGFRVVGRFTESRWVPC